MKIGEVINILAIKAGLAPDSDDLKTLLSAPELMAVDVPESISEALDKSLLSVEAAKNNHPDVKKKYAADIYDGIDKLLMTLIASDTFEQSDLDEIKAERSTSKKAELIITKLKEAKKNAKPADKDAINEQIKAAHEAARLAKQEVEQIKNDYEGKIKDIYKKAALKSLFSQYKTIYDELPVDAKEYALEGLINKALQDKNAEFSTDEHGNLQLIGKDGSNVFGSNHAQLTTQSFVDQTLAPILKKSGITPAAPTQAQPTEPANKVPASLKSHTEKVLAEINRPATSLM